MRPYTKGGHTVYRRTFFFSKGLFCGAAVFCEVRHKGDVDGDNRRPGNV
jgi:hypothetical protein